MGYQSVSLATSLMIIGSFLLASNVLLPKSVFYWKKWQQTKRSIFLSHAAALGCLGVYLLALLLLMLIPIFQ